MMSTVDEVKRRLEQPQTLSELATNMRELFKASSTDRHKVPDVLLLFGYNGIGKTRLCMEFKKQGGKGTSGDTLYFNAFTEDLFTWDNDLQNDTTRSLKLNMDSRFFSGVTSEAMEQRVHGFLDRHADFNFKIDTTDWKVSFFRQNDGLDAANIKISRGEERLFIWCYFLAILQYVLDGSDEYAWVKYVYIDDPISSLDDNNVVALSCQFTKMFKEKNNAGLKLIISTHHSLFYNIMYYELRKKSLTYFYNSNKDGLFLKSSNDSPFFHHIALLAQLKQAADEGNLYTYHFNILRVILEKTARFYGFENFSKCLGVTASEPDGNETGVSEESRLINLMSHGKYSLFEPREMVPDNKEIFKNVLNRFLERYPFNLDALM